MIVNFYFYFVLLYILFYDIDMKIYEEDWKYFFGGKERIFNLKKKNKQERKRKKYFVDR